MNYLKKNQYERWIEIDNSNFTTKASYPYNYEDCEDETIQSYKTKLRLIRKRKNIALIVLFVFVAIALPTLVMLASCGYE